MTSNPEITWNHHFLMSSTGKRSQPLRRSPRRKAKEHKVLEEEEPKKKRQKLVRTPTETLEVVDEPKAVLDKKTTSYLEQIQSDSDSIAELSEESRTRLMRELSTIINPLGSGMLVSSSSRL